MSEINKEKEQRKTLFANKTMTVFKSIFEKPQKFKNIIEFISKYSDLFPLVKPTYSWHQTFDKTDRVKYDGVDKDKEYIKQYFVYGKYVPYPNEKNRFKQVGRAIFQDLYYDFLILANIINHNDTRKDIHFGGFNALIANSWNGCICDISLTLRSIMDLNENTPTNDDISIWKISALSNESIQIPAIKEVREQLNSLNQLFDFDNIFKKFISKTFAHVTTFSINEAFTPEQQQLISPNGMFNFYECIYACVKILYHIINPSEMQHILWDAPNYDGDLLHQLEYKKAWKNHYDFGMIKDVEDPFTWAKIGFFCKCNNIINEPSKWSIEEINKIQTYILGELKKSVKLRDGKLLSMAWGNRIFDLNNLLEKINPKNNAK